MPGAGQATLPESRKHPQWSSSAGCVAELKLTIEWWFESDHKNWSTDWLQTDKISIVMKVFQKFWSMVISLNPAKTVDSVSRPRTSNKTWPTWPSSAERTAWFFSGFDKEACSYSPLGWGQDFLGMALWCLGTCWFGRQMRESRVSKRYESCGQHIALQLF